MSTVGQEAPARGPRGSPADQVVDADRPVAPSRGLVTRRRLEIALGLLWLLDGALQFQPYMFTDAFFKDILGMANMGLPGPIATLDYDVARMLGTHPVAWNAIFASLQVGLGLGLLWRPTARVARAASIAWTLGVWVVGEGFGGLFMPGTSLVTGAPGPALLYAVAAVVLWPRREGADGPAAVGAALHGATPADWVWTALWTVAAAMELEGANHAAVVPGAQLSNGAEGEPGVLATLNHAAGHLVAGQGAVFAGVVASAALFVGWGVLWGETRRMALALGITVAVIFGIIGQDLGTILTGRGTDPGTGPLFVLLALALWPRRSGLYRPPRPTSRRSSPLFHG